MCFGQRIRGHVQMPKVCVDGILQRIFVWEQSRGIRDTYYHEISTINIHAQDGMLTKFQLHQHK
jgi:hypothetical protein